MIKSNIKKILLKVGLWYPLQFIRQSYSCVRWLTGGAKSPAPHSVKLLIIQSYLKQYKMYNFIETGTYLGETLGFIGRLHYVNCSSIELSPELYASASIRFHGQDNVKLFLGDSGVVLPNILSKLKEPALFWLDGHYSGGISARSEIDSPVYRELDSILKHPIKSHVVLIDDVRCFDGTDGYPQLDKLIQTVRLDGNYDIEVTTDIIRLTKKNKPVPESSSYKL